MKNTTETIREIINTHSIVLFMKGYPEAPACGFSARAVAILKANGVELEKIHAINVLEDEAIRQEIKVFSNWPTIPQLYIKGDFIGGSDIMLEMHETGELQELIEQI
jgi:monothiol glutaredoxin